MTKYHREFPGAFFRRTVFDAAGADCRRPRFVFRLVGGMLLALSALVSAADSGGVSFYPRADAYPFSDAVKVGDVLFLSGQIGATEDETAVVPGGMAAETRRMIAAPR